MDTVKLDSPLLPIETPHLLLRTFTENDFAAVHSYASRAENTVYMLLGLNNEEDTRRFISQAIAAAEAAPVTNYQLAAALKDGGRLIGACDLQICGESEAAIGWILHSGYWRQGYGSEMGNALLRFGFEKLGLHRIIAYCDAENQASFRLMEKIGMRREGLFLEGRKANKLSDLPYGDELAYAILRDEWETRKEIALYNALPCIFNGFIDVPALTDRELYLVCTKKSPAQPEKKWVPSYHFAVCKDGEQIGGIDLRIGYTDGLYYGGQVGYSVNENYRGNNYAARACRLLLPVAKAHGMTKLLITNNRANAASRRVCEKLGAKLIRAARLPEWTDLYQQGNRFENIFEWDISML